MQEPPQPPKIPEHEPDINDSPWPRTPYEWAVILMLVLLFLLLFTPAQML